MKRSLKFPKGWAVALLLLGVQMEVATSSPVVGACKGVALHHNGIEPQTSAAPYQLAVSTEAVVAGGTLSVVLSSDSGKEFQGFFIEARDVETDAIVGTFQTEEWQYVDCGPDGQNAVTHPDTPTQTSVAVDWAAPADYEGVIVFRATVVHFYEYAFWEGIESTEVAVAVPRGPARSRAPKTLREAYDGCGVTKGCFGIMDTCVDTADCMVTITYAKADTGYAMEVFGLADTTDVYMAGGLSFDTNMANTSVMACRSYQGQVDVVMAFNTVGHSNDILPIPDMGLSDVVVSQEDGLLYCSFTREASLVVGGFVYDLDTDPFYLEVAHGNLSDTGALTHHKHHGVTDEEVDLGAFP